jgi:hypothetical protein
MVNRDLIKAFEISFPLNAPTPAVSDRLHLRDWLHSWLFEFRVLANDEQWQRIDNWDIPRFVQLTMPACKTQEDAKLICAWIAWLHIFDDEFDAPPLSRDPAAAEVLIRPYLEYLERIRDGRTVYMNSEPNNGLLNAFIALNRWTLSPMSQVWQLRWLGDMEDYVRAYVTETEHRKAGVILKPEELISFKRVSMAQRSVINLIERVITSELSSNVYALIGPVVDNVSDITGALNDPVSLAKEQACGDSHNLIMCLMHHQSISEREALSYLVRFVDTRCHDLLQAIQEIPIDPRVQSERQTVAEWMTNCGSWVRGYYEWLQETMRFEENCIYKSLADVNETKRQESIQFEETDI